MGTQKSPKKCPAGRQTCPGTFPGHLGQLWVLSQNPSESARNGPTRWLKSTSQSCFFDLRDQRAPQKSPKKCPAGRQTCLGPFPGHLGQLWFQSRKKNLVYFSPYFFAKNHPILGGVGESHKAKNGRKLTKIRRTPRADKKHPHWVREPPTNPPRAVRRQNYSKGTFFVTHFGRKPPKTLIAFFYHQYTKSVRVDLGNVLGCLAGLPRCKNVLGWRGQLFVHPPTGCPMFSTEFVGT